MKKIMVIGAGGIGSFLIPLLNRVKEYEITVWDNDIVEEKNLSYQDFNAEDVGKYKTDVMAKRYDTVTSQPYRVLTKKQMEGYDLVVCCVDNLELRRMLYLLDIEEIKWLDLRAQARNGLLISFQENPDNFSILTNGPDGNFSCQGDEWDRSNKGVHFTHVAIAGLGAQWVQRYFAGDKTHTHVRVAI